MEEVIYAIEVIVQICENMNVDVYVFCFFDCEKAFETIKHKLLIIYQATDHSISS